MKKAVMTVTRFNEDIITTSGGPGSGDSGSGDLICNWLGFKTAKGIGDGSIPYSTFYNTSPDNSFKANTTGSGTVYGSQTTSVSSGDELWGGNESPFVYGSTATSDNQAGFLNTSTHYHFGYNGTTYYWYECSDVTSHGLQ